jgi:hypothetical protein
MPKLNQIIAIEKGVKNQQNQVITEAHHVLQKAPLLSGIARSYQPRDEEGEKLPGESTLVQVRAADTFDKIADAWSELVNITMTKDEANTGARADVEVDGEVLMKGVPVSSLLFLEKQLVDLHAVIKKLPTLDPSEKWSHDDAQNCWATEPAQTARSKKIPRNHVKAPATDKHPAQVEIWHEDIMVGTWKTIKYSGAMQASRQAEMLTRVEKLQRAVKFAREAANNVECSTVKSGRKIFDYVLA